MLLEGIAAEQNEPQLLGYKGPARAIAAASAAAFGMPDRVDNGPANDRRYHHCQQVKRSEG
jgi:hypothetical protein